MGLDIEPWNLPLLVKRPSKTQLYELHTIYEEDEENVEEIEFLSSSDSQVTTQYKSQLERFSYMVILVGLILSLLLLMGRPLAKATTLILN